MKVNADRLWNRLNQIGSIGADPKGGISRFSWTPEYHYGINKLIALLEEAGIGVRLDSVGNLFGRIEGDGNLPAVLTGSHFDTVPHGGKFDGLAGVMSALEALTCIKESGIRLKRPVEMVALINEEATEFLGGLFGSKAICGMLPDNYADITRDKSTGRLLRDAMKEFGMGLDPDRIRASMRGREEFYRFFELHIEQAGLLEERDLPVGIVTTIAGIHQMKFELTGRSAHAGAMPMEQRKDAMAAAASIACEVERLAKNSGSETRATVGYISAYPGEHNIIAGNATIPVDIREKNPVVRKRIFDSLLQCVEQECRSRGVKSEIQLTLDSPPVNCDPRVVNLFANAAKQQGVPFMEIVSYAAHDAMNMATLCPMGMIFVRSKDGLSHCPEEFTSKEDLAAGANVLLNSMIQAASE